MEEPRVSQATAVREIYGAIRDIPDFPKPGILFKDITPLLLDAALFRRAIDLMAAPFRASGVTRVVSIESRGFLLGAPIALAIEAGLVDDVLATGGTAQAAAKLVRNHGAQVVGFTFLIELDFLKGRERLKNERIEALLHYA
ncbi:MAG: adenine phosphoribosyltransferase [Gemmatimonadetes bacterium]|nr:MAG: adenine phosphoribosyltransferase [Gemmatimonadota bacterium]